MYTNAMNGYYKCFKECMPSVDPMNIRLIADGCFQLIGIFKINQQINTSRAHPASGCVSHRLNQICWFEILL